MKQNRKYSKYFGGPVLTEAEHKLNETPIAENLIEVATDEVEIKPKKKITKKKLNKEV